MRLRRLDLTRYGKFTDKVIDFGERPDRKPDLHVIYGPNEAGKSTTLSAFLDLLFGIETRSRYNFLHPYPNMRIGGMLDVAGGSRSFLRIKRPQNSLLDAHEQPIADSAILGDIGSIDRDAYRTMFSLDDETLEAGGESILASRGELGELLFSASTGLADLSNRLVEMRAGTDAFYKFRARAGELAALKDRLAQLKTERETIDTMATDYAMLVEAREQATRQYDAAIGERGQAQRRIDEIRRLLAVMPRLAGLRDMRDRLEPLAGLKDPPDGWRERLPDLLKQEIELSVRSETLAANITRMHADIETIAVDRSALELAAQVERLADPRARYITAEKDLPERRMQLRAFDIVVEGLLMRIERSGETEPSRLMLSASIIGQLRELMESRSGIDTALAAAEQEFSDAGDGLEQAAIALSKLNGGRQTDIATANQLSQALANARAADFTGRSMAAAKALAGEQEKLRLRMDALRPWTGDETALTDMNVPDVETIGRLKSRLEDAEKQHTRRRDETERLTTEVLLLEAELGAITGAGGILTDQQAAETRIARETAWSAHRQSLDLVSAEAFEAALRSDDIVTAGRMAHVTDLANYTSKSQVQAARRAALQRSQELLAVAETDLHDIRQKIAGLLQGLGLDESLSLTQLESWLVKRVSALEAAQSRLGAQRDLHDAEANEHAARTKLAAALELAGQTIATDEPLETLIAQAQTFTDRETVLASARQAVDAGQREVEARQKAFARAQSRLEDWERSWRQACEACWLGDRRTMPKISTVRETLVILQELGPALEKRADLADRIEKMENDQTEFRATIETLAAALGLAPSSTDIIQLAETLQDSVHKAVAARNSRTEAQSRLSKSLDEQRDLQATVTLHGRHKQEMTIFFAVETLDDVSERLRLIAIRADLQAKIKSTEHEILDALRLTDMGEAERALDAADREALELELIELEPRLGDLDRRCQELYAEKTSATDRLEAVGGDARVAALEEKRRTTLLEIEDGATHYLKLRLGIVAAEHALRAYRDQHRSSMMTKASEAFQIISRGAYSGLATQPDRDKETLIAVSASGGSKAAAELSKGTRFQLYLALRVAGYHEFVAASGPVPFIADDIMETFDDFRAEEAFRLFAGMAEIGQVIYLTHHRHLCEIARKISPDVRVHELG